MKALIGFSGFVGQTLLKQTKFDELYRSTNIQEIAGKNFNEIVCAGVSAKKWLANKDPETDIKQINYLIEQLKKIKSCKHFILISTVDVFSNPNCVNESTKIDKNDLHPYGLHRWYLEQFVESHFANHLIVRLPGLVGPGLAKNIIFDFLNQNNLPLINSEDVFQFYPMVNLWNDLQIASKENLNLIHFTSSPIKVAEIAKNVFGLEFENKIQSRAAIKYDFRTNFSQLFGATEKNYQYSFREQILAIRAYAQSESITLK